MATNRKRHQPVLNNNIVDNHLNDEAPSFKSRGNVFDGRLVSLLVFGFYAAGILFVRYRLLLFPEPKAQYPTSPNNSFYELNARIHLKHFSLHGPRVVGSDSNEIFAYRYILQEVTKIKKNALPTKQIDISEQNVSGAFELAFLSDFVSVYKNIKNIVVKLGSETGSQHSLLMSCHFDSSVESPGAGDNAISCAIMLELLRVFSHSPQPVHHSIIFLFNGAEENLLQASHGFITQHPWAKSIKAFVNIDSAGAGGWEVVFQTGPAHRWLVREYAEASPYPGGSILGQEIFQSGLIPSDTDFRIFRDFGEIPGLDIAYITNGYVYHTQLDQNRFIQAGCVQRGGENLLALLKKLSGSAQLGEAGGEERDGSMVYFDLVGLIMVCYSHSTGTAINILVCLAVLIKIATKALNLHKNVNHDSKYLGNLVTAVGCVLLTWLVIVVTCVGMALLLTVLGRNMSWYSTNLNLLPAFILPPTIAVILLHDTLRNTLFKRNSSWYNEQLLFEANLAIWCVLLLLLTLLGVGSAFVPMLYLAGPLLLREGTLAALKHKKWPTGRWVFLVVHLLGQGLPVVVTSYIMYCFMLLFLPIMGRVGTEVNPDIVISIMAALTLVLMISYMVSLMYLCGGQRRVAAVLAAVVGVWLAAILLTPLGFPYSGDHDAPAPMRLLAFHIRRRVYDLAGAQTYEDAGIWHIPFDVNQPGQEASVMPTLQQARPLNCDLGPYCALPFLIPVAAMFNPKKSLYVPLEAHDRPSVVCSLVNKEVDPHAFTTLTFQVTGPDHMSMVIRPHEGVTLVRYSFVPDEPKPSLMPADLQHEVNYYVYYSHGEKPSKPWTFSLYLKVGAEHAASSGLLDLAFSGHYLHGPARRTPQLDKFNSEVPDWASPLLWTATWDGYVF